MSDPYWTSRHEVFCKEEGVGDGNTNLKEAAKNYATAWSIFASLLMTVSFSLIPVDTGSFYDENSEEGNRIFSFVYVVLLLMSTIFSFLAVLVGTFRYTFWDGIPATLLAEAITSMEMPGSEAFVYPAIGTQFLASVAGCYLFLGYEMFIAALLLFFGFFVPGLIFVSFKYRASFAKLASLGIRAGSLAPNVGQQKPVHMADDSNGGMVTASLKMAESPENEQ
mmetsp:Transcript_8251/g.12790  ORF Transcript_8251/g.12790 Transcript_8251/m.12790 type:complete len:223 (+) Transcript_8251:66-734(+)|eukprot:CAMPEP_0202688222 /NCGR_PEP_ID=MMETSP1385-20130828/3759_1 /ASSEMBLY_ACC=CAM_ASM_000861 /TAXON_ID=933848 /ORGANISM="Elphidium margaritaceum" /LENGTH=222 /DNA_ID=CAMNT_0049343141 /DNA_START=62 /DNA_END=730 /DNA_ORIENTATION=+